MNGAPYDFDPAKAAANLRKHGLTFDDGYRVLTWSPDLLLEKPDPHDGEDRWNVLGPHPEVPWAILHVTYLRRAGRLRIFSVRKATRAERAEYDQQFR